MMICHFSALHHRGASTRSPQRRLPTFLSFGLCCGLAQVLRQHTLLATQFSSFTLLSVCLCRTLDYKTNYWRTKFKFSKVCKPNRKLIPQRVAIDNNSDS